MSLTYQLNQLELNGLVNLAQTMPEVEYLFRHALVQDAAYQSLLYTTRQELHQAVGVCLESLYPDYADELAPLLAHHFLAAGKAGKAAHYLLQAGQAALDRFAHQEAVDYFSKVVQLTRQAIGNEAYNQCLIGLAKANQAQGNNQFALQHLAEALALAADPYQQADILDQMGYIYGSHLHDTEQARDSFRRAIEILGEGDRSVTMARICVNFGHLLYFAESDREQCKHYLHRARQLLEGTPHKAELAECYSQLSLAFFDTEPEEAIRYGRLSLAIAPRVDSSTIMAHQALFNAYQVLRDLEQARYHLELAREMSRKMGRVVDEGYAELNLMILCMRLKQYPEAVQAGQRARQIWQQVGNPGVVGDVLSALIVASHLVGESDAAEQYEAEANSLPIREGRFFYNQACWWSTGGNQDKALEILAEVYPSLDERIRQLVLTDADLVAVRERPEFWEIVGDSTAEE